MNAEKNIKNQARVILRNGNFTKGIGVFTVLMMFVILIYLCRYFLICAAVGEEYFDNGHALSADEAVRLVTINTLTWIFAIFCSPVINGFLRFYFNTAKTGDGVFSDIFYYFDSKRLYASAMLFNLNLLIRFLPCYVLLTSAIIFFSLCNTLYTVVGCVMAFSFIVLFFALFLRYFAAFGLYFSNENQKPSEYFKKSAVIMKRYRKSVLKLIFSFIGWIILSIVIIPLIYTVPYFAMSLSVSLKWIMYNESRTNAVQTAEALTTAEV